MIEIRFNGDEADRKRIERLAAIWKTTPQGAIRQALKNAEFYQDCLIAGDRILVEDHKGRLSIVKSVRTSEQE